MVEFFRILCAIRIHVWGGLGSQLNGINVALRLQQKFPKRRLILIFHTSGVTRRPLELNPDRLPFASLQIDDYVKFISVKDNSNFNRLWKWKILNMISSILKKMFYGAGLMSGANNELEFLAIRPHVMMVRGHYSDLEVSKIHALEIWNLVFGEVPNHSLSNVSTLHLRLGDLLLLEEKGPIARSRLGDCLNRVNSQFNVGEISVFSDGSHADVDNFLRSNKFHITFTFLESDTISLIRECSLSKIFVGTNSKVSLWVARFRSMKDRSSLSFIPFEFSKHFHDTRSDLVFY